MNGLPDIHVGPERASVVRLLERASLPTADLTDVDMRSFFYAGSSSAPIGIIGVQLYDTHALLRSLVVSDEHRARGLGSALVVRAEQHARERGVRTMSLLTTTAERFFLSRGYRVAARDSAPAAIRATAEFASLCPASSAFLSKHLETR
jgi:amino-acid N-acetyltransferase